MSVLLGMLTALVNVSVVVVDSTAEDDRVIVFAVVSTATTVTVNAEMPMPVTVLPTAMEDAEVVVTVALS